MSILSIIKFIHRYLPFVTKMSMAIFYFFMAHVIQYRKSVITQNLKNSFPDNTVDIAKVRSQFYKIFSRNLLEILDLITFDKDILSQKMSCDVTNIDMKKGGILMASHFGNWERNLACLPIFITEAPVLGFYKPLKNKFMNSLMQQIRGKFSNLLEPIDRTVRVLAAHKGEPIFYVFIADQGPVNMNGVYWNTFLHQRTPWLRGAEKLAEKYNLPVYYVHQTPTESGKYHLHFSKISDPDMHLDSTEIIEKYTRFLEDEINAHPPYWLWSHRRWKRAHMEQKSLPE